MNLRQRVQELLEFLASNPAPEQVYEKFYAEDVVVQENLQPPRVGRALSIERQQRMNANLKEVHEFKIGAVLVDGFTEAHPLDGQSVIEAHIDLSTQDGYRIRIEELAMQTWKNGKIIYERFFYDPGDIQGKSKEINAIH